VGAGTPARLAQAAALGAMVALFGYLAWDSPLWEPRLQLLVHAIAGVAAVGLVVLMLRGVPLPRTRLDLPLIALLTAMGIASLSAWNVGLSARALAAMIGFAIALPASLLALRHLPRQTALAVSVPILLLAAGGLAVMLPRRVEWYLAGGPGIVPPARFGADGSAFGGVAVPPFVILAALPLTLLLPAGRGRRILQLALVAVGVPLTVFSGSRSAWLAIGVAGLVFAGPLVRQISLRPRLTRRALAVAGLVLVAALPLALMLAPRLVAFTSVIYRGFLWRDTLAAALMDPILGLGPGAMPYARQAAAPPLSFPVHQPHSHNILLGLFGDGGVFGLLAGLILFGVFLSAAGPWRQRTFRGRAAASVLIGFGVAGLAEDLTFLPGFDLLVILLAALALTDADAVDWQPRRIPAPLAAGGALAGIALATVTLLGDAAAIEYAAGIEAGVEGRWAAASDRFGAAERLDAWHPMHPKALAVAAAVAGDPATAAAAAGRAVALNPGDGSSWANLALLCRAAGDTSCARSAAEAAVHSASSSGRELVNAALVFEALGDVDAADEAYVRTLLTNRYAGFVTSWPRRVDTEGLELIELGLHDRELNRLLARLSQGLDAEPEAYQSRPVRALALALAGRTDEARSTLEAALANDTEIELTWEVAALLRRHWGEEIGDTLTLAELVRGTPLRSGPGRLSGAIFDIAAFRRVPIDGLIRNAEHLVPEERWPWFVEPFLPPG
jgi:tetratricopeptide (TPR) repeat protein/O-antigen ligase